MNAPANLPEEIDPIAQAAAEWAIRHDRGLTASEQDDFTQWLATDARHRAAWAEHRWGWEELDRLAGLQTSIHAVPDPDLLAPKTAGKFQALFPAVLAAAALILIVWAVYPWASPAAPLAESPTRVVRSLALIEQRELPDGSVVELNRGAVLSERFTSGERRVRLERGEAHFKVAKDAARPFFVEASGVAVRAVGTAFNVRLDSASVEVLVTEGKVSVAPESVATGAVSPTFVTVNERTVVSLAPAAPAPQVTVVPPAEIEARLAWQPRLLDFNDASLVEIVAEFNRRNPVHITLGDPALRGLRLSASFRSDNVEGFVRLMESDFGMRAEWRRDDEIELMKVR